MHSASHCLFEGFTHTSKTLPPSRVEAPVNALDVDDTCRWCCHMCCIGVVFVHGAVCATSDCRCSAHLDSRYASGPMPPLLPSRPRFRLLDCLSLGLPLHMEHELDWRACLPQSVPFGVATLVGVSLLRLCPLYDERVCLQILWYFAHVAGTAFDIGVHTPPSSHSRWRVAEVGALALLHR